MGLAEQHVLVTPALPHVCTHTGSGKTASFLIPMVERLVKHSTQMGARALVISPTRELSLQTHKFAKAFTKFTDLRSCLLVGGTGFQAQVQRPHHRTPITSSPTFVASFCVCCLFSFSSVFLFSVPNACQQPRHYHCHARPPHAPAHGGL